MLELAALVALVLFLSLGIPLAIVNSRNHGCATAVSCNHWLSSFSVFNSFDSNNSIDLIFYLSVLTVVL